MKNKSGFLLIELMIAVGIMSMTAAGALYSRSYLSGSYLKKRDKSAWDGMNQLLRNLYSLKGNCAASFGGGSGIVYNTNPVPLNQLVVQNGTTTVVLLSTNPAVRSDQLYATSIQLIPLGSAPTQTDSKGASTPLSTDWLLLSIQGTMSVSQTAVGTETPAVAANQDLASTSIIIRAQSVTVAGGKQIVSCGVDEDSSGAFQQALGWDESLYSPTPTVPHTNHFHGAYSTSSFKLNAKNSIVHPAIQWGEPTPVASGGANYIPESSVNVGIMATQNSPATSSMGLYYNNTLALNMGGTELPLNGVSATFPMYVSTLSDASGSQSLAVQNITFMDTAQINHFNADKSQVTLSSLQLGSASNLLVSGSVTVSTASRGASLPPSVQTNALPDSTKCRTVGASGCTYFALCNADEFVLGGGMQCPQGPPALAAMISMPVSNGCGSGLQGWNGQCTNPSAPGVAVQPSNIWAYCCPKGTP